MLALVWIVFYLVLFYSAGTQGGRLRGVAVGEMVVEAVFPPAGAEAEAEGGAQALAQRIWLLSVVMMLLAAALGWGYVLLRSMRVSERLAAAERAIFAYGAGTALLSWGALVTGAAGLMQRPLHLMLLLAGPLLAVALAVRARHAAGARSYRTHATKRHANDADRVRDQQRGSPNAVTRMRWVSGQVVWLVPAMVPIGLIFAGAMLPPDGGHQYFDIKEYHLQAPKEFFLQGWITFLEHNVYASMPLGTEMLSLLAMIVVGDWWWGALVGQTFLATFAPATAMLLFVAGRRFFGGTAGAIAAILYLATPAIFEVSTTAYVEGGFCFYLAAAVYAFALACGSAKPAVPGSESFRPASKSRLCFLAGFLAGAAAACKYPGVAYVVLPLGLACWVPLSRSPEDGTRTRAAAMFLAGALLTFAPWLVRNAIDTSNPVYPLLWSVFGGRGWSAAHDARWWQAHGPPGFTWGHVASGIWQVAVGSSARSPLNPLLIGFAVLAPVVPAYRRRALRLAAYVLFVLVVWWSATHRIDRFWYPVIPLIALLAGAGGAWLAKQVSPAPVAVLVLASLFVVVAQAATRHPLWNAYGWRLYGLDVTKARETFTKPQVSYLNHELPPDAVVLSVGEAAVFDFRRTVFYATAFNDRMFGRWLADGGADLAQLGITHVYVDWAEIARYRGAGNYGFTDAVSPRLFEDLVSRGVLGRPIEFDQRGQLLVRQPMSVAPVVQYALYPVGHPERTAQTSETFSFRRHLP